MSKYVSVLIFLCFVSAKLTRAQTDPVNWTKHLISDTLTGAKKNVVADVDLDGNKNMDIVVIANPEGSGPEDGTQENVLWFQNLGDEVFEQHTIDYRFAGARGLAVGDLTGDGKPDVIAGNKQADSALVWYRNDGNSNWTRIPLGGPAPNNYSIVLSDVNGDGRLDIVDGMGDDADSIGVGSGIIDDSLRWFENTSLTTDTAVFSVHLIARYSSPSGIAAADFNGDNSIDVAAMSWVNYYTLTPDTSEDVRWWSQQAGISWLQEQVLIKSYGGNDLQPADLDQNGTVDLVGAGYKTASLDWWSNNGSGVFSTAGTIVSNFQYTRNVQVADIDGDGDPDIAAAADNLNTISWFENDGAQNFTRHDVTTTFTYAYHVTAYDLNGDGDMDLIGTAQNAGELSWWENDLAEEQTAAAGDPDTLYFDQNRVRIDYQNGFSGGTTSVFFNHGVVSNRSDIDSNLDHVTQNGYYTIVCRASAYDAAIVFEYGNISEWQGTAADESTLRICYWNESAGLWQIAGSTAQTVDTVRKRITVYGLQSELVKFSRFTIGEAAPVSALAGSEWESSFPARPLMIHPNYPNPFNGSTQIRLSVRNSDAPVSVRIYDLRGRLVKQLFRGAVPTGKLNLIWNALDDKQRAVSSGMYVVVLRQNNRFVNRRILLIK